MCKAASLQFPFCFSPRRAEQLLDLSSSNPQGTAGCKGNGVRFSEESYCVLLAFVISCKHICKFIQYKDN